MSNKIIKEAVMNDTEKRFTELADRALQRCYTTFTDFLNMDEQSILGSMRLGAPYRLFGGYDFAERCVAGFGEYCESAEFPISIIKIEPIAQRFADRLTHRDFLGSLMGLGIRREMLGDIVICDNVGYLFCLETIQQYIILNLDKVKHTSVKCTGVSELAHGAVKEPEEKQLIVASERLDVIIAGVYSFSRSEIKEMFTARKIFVNSRLCENYSQIAKSGDVISVRGRGRFIYDAALGTTKKNRQIIRVRVYE